MLNTMALGSERITTIDVSKNEGQGFSFKDWERLRSGFYSPDEEPEKSFNSSDDSTVSISWSSSSSVCEDGIDRPRKLTKISRHVITRLNFDECVNQRQKTPRQKRAKVKRFVKSHNIHNIQNTVNVSVASPLLKTDSRNICLEKNNSGTNMAVQNTVSVCYESALNSHTSYGTNRICGRNSTVPCKITHSKDICVTNLSPSKFTFEEKNHVNVDNNCLFTKEMVQRTPPKLNNQEMELTISSPIISSNIRCQRSSKHRSSATPLESHKDKRDIETSPIIGSCRKISSSPIIGSCKVGVSHKKHSVKRQRYRCNEEIEKYNTHSTTKDNVLSTSLITCSYVSPSPVIDSCKVSCHSKSFKRETKPKKNCLSSHLGCEPLTTSPIVDTHASNSPMTDFVQSSALDENQTSKNLIASDKSNSAVPTRSNVSSKALTENHRFHKNIPYQGILDPKRAFVDSASLIENEWEFSNNGLIETCMSQSVIFSNNNIHSSSIPQSPVLGQGSIIKIRKKRRKKDHSCRNKRAINLVPSSVEQLHRNSDLHHEQGPISFNLFPIQFEESTSNGCDKENEFCVTRIDIKKFPTLNNVNLKNVPQIKFSLNDERCLSRDKDMADASGVDSFNKSVIPNLPSIQTQFIVPCSSTVQTLKGNKDDCGTQECDVLDISFDTQTMNFSVREAHIPAIVVDNIKPVIVDHSFYSQVEPNICDSRIDTIPDIENCLDSKLCIDEGAGILTGCEGQRLTKLDLRKNSSSSVLSIESISSQEVVAENNCAEKQKNTQSTSSCGPQSISQQTSPSRSNPLEDVVSSGSASQENVILDLQSPLRIQRPLINMDSAKKRKRIKKDGLARRLQKLLNRQRSAARMWQHELSDVKYCSPRGTLFIINKVWVECSHIVILCNLSSDHPGQQKQQAGDCDVNRTEEPKSCSPGTVVEDVGSTWIIVLNPDMLPLAQLKPECAIRLYPPWQTLKISRMNISLILSVTYAVLVSASSVSNITPQPAEISSVKEFSCPCLQGSTLLKSCSFELPRRGLDLLELFFPLKHPSCENTSADCRLLFVEKEASDQKGTVAEAVSNYSHALINNIWVQLYILRVFCYRQSNSQCNKGEAKDSTSNLLWSVLGKDVSGECCEVILGSQPVVSSENEMSREWNMIISRTALGCTYKFSGLMVMKKISGNMASGLLTTIQNSNEDDISSTMQLYVLSVSSDAWKMACIKFSEPELHCVLSDECQHLTEVLKQIDEQHCSRYTVLVKLLTVVDCYFYITDSSLCGPNSSSCTPMYAIVNVKPLCYIPSKISSRKANIVYIQDLQLFRGELYADKYTRILVATNRNSVITDLTFTMLVDEKLISPLICLQPSLGRLRQSSVYRDLVTVTGKVVQIDEETAYAWPSCAHCSNDLLCELDESMYLCQNCNDLAEICTKMSLEIFVLCPELPAHCQLKIKLQQESIASLLPPTQNDGNGYEMSSVLNKDVGPLLCVVLKAKTTTSKNGEVESIHFALEEVPSWENIFQTQLQEINKMFNTGYNEEM